MTDPVNMTLTGLIASYQTERYKKTDPKAMESEVESKKNKYCRIN